MRGQLADTIDCGCWVGSGGTNGNQLLGVPGDGAWHSPGPAGSGSAGTARLIQLGWYSSVGTVRLVQLGQFSSAIVKGHSLKSHSTCMHENLKILTHSYNRHRYN